MGKIKPGHNTKVYYNILISNVFLNLHLPYTWDYL